jgi:quercetin dioxygenase-like cupin family protein
MRILSTTEQLLHETVRSIDIQSLSLFMCMKIVTFDKGRDILNQDGCLGKRLLMSQGLEIVHLTVESKSIIESHALPFPVIFHVLEGNGTLIVENEGVTVATGTTIECPPNTQRGWENHSSSALKLLVIKCTGI